MRYLHMGIAASHALQWFFKLYRIANSSLELLGSVSTVNAWSVQISSDYRLPVHPSSF